MRRYFNTEGLCDPKEHYMVRLDERLAEIKQLYVDRKKYFAINRGRQYGKTTTLYALAAYLKDEYTVLSVDFQELGTADFVNEAVFVRAFSRLLMEAADMKAADIEAADMEAAVMDEDGMKNMSELLKELSDMPGNSGLNELFIRLSRLCLKAQKPVVLMIDEADSASNNQVFLDFLAQLRGYYLARRKKAIFHSVILAGVYDIKNLKLKLRPEAEHKYNSPWNISADFDMDMSFSVLQIAGMLREYASENHIEMDVREVAEEMERYTSGYPYLVSAVCRLMDEKLPAEEESLNIWTKSGVARAVNMLLKKSTPLFESMVKQLDIYQELREMLEQILYQGRHIPFEPDVEPISIGKMFGFLKEENGQTAVSNRIFEMKLLNTFITREALQSESYRYSQSHISQFITDGRLDMERVLEKFVVHFHDVYGSENDKFIEDYGRKFFLLYLKPIINGTGNYYIEAQTRNAKRTDVIVDYHGEQFVIELKIWHGKEYHERGEKQLAGYLDYYHTEKGYLISFNFNKHKKTGIQKIQIGSRTIVEAVV